MFNAVFWRFAFGFGCGPAFDIEIHPAPSAAEGFFFAGFSSNWRMFMLRAGLLREQYQFFCAATFGIKVNNQLQTGAFGVTKTEIRGLHILCFFGCDDDVRLFEQLKRFNNQFLLFVFCNHKVNRPHQRSGQAAALAPIMFFPFRGEFNILIGIEQIKV